ncbi:hypothetical protein EIP86_001557 [Pleurotus ostreatoroseus]|nr:hypothetical protein EIP86_001557 [Pleurotus ostreatoroseus]
MVPAPSLEDVEMSNAWEEPLRELEDRSEADEQADADAMPPSRRTRVEEVEDNDSPRYAQPFPQASDAGAVYGSAKTMFDLIRDDQVLKGAEVWGPFENDEEWQLAKWLIKNVGHNQAEEFLQLGIIRSMSLAYSNEDKLYKAVDELPKGFQWHCREITQTGDLKDADGKYLTETVEVWYRNPVECVRELLGNPLFAKLLAYAPECVYRDRTGKERHIDEMWTADWWWDLQTRVAKGLTIAPIILSSDKTKLSQFRGDKSAWPIYLTVGNLAKEARRSPSMHGTILLGYLPVGKFDCFSTKAARSLAVYQTFHTSIKIILSELVKVAAEGGVEMTCADRCIRKILPILAAYVADYPEQCLVANCKENRCPIGEISPELRGSHEHCVLRDQTETLRLLDLHWRGALGDEDQDRFNKLGLRAIYDPFWRGLPYCDIFQCFTPDLLHQLHKGVFKDHLVKWCTQLVGETELDQRFISTPSSSGLRHFKKGISGVSQWTGHEHKEMEKVFLGLVAGAVDKRVVLAVRALMDFIYLASLQSHTTTTLAALEQALDDFHAHKEVFIEFGARSPAHFNIPKYHMLEHYVSLIKKFGSADGFNTEWSERLHIDYAKDAYRASNKRDYVSQMTQWLARQEAVDRFAVYLEWYQNGEYKPEAGDASLEPLPTEVEDTGPQTQEASEDLAPSNVPHGYRVPVRPTVRNVPAAKIIQSHNASEFIPAVKAFLRAHGSSVTPYDFDGFDLYKHVITELPEISEVSPRKEQRSVIRASPPTPSLGRRHAQPAILDFALVRTGERNDDTDGTALEGMS